MSLSREELYAAALVEAYELARRGPFIYQSSSPGLLQIAGPDRIAYLQRQTTNDLNALSPGRILVTVLTSPAARIIDLLTLFYPVGPGGDEAAISLITLPGRGGRTADYFRQRIFFMDKVSVEDLSSHSVQIELSGPGAAGSLRSIGITSPAGLGDYLGGAQDGALWQVFRLPDLVGERYLLLTDQAGGEKLRRDLASQGIIEIDRLVYDTLRVEAGLPGGDTELTEAYTPLETGLEYAISDQKGCYTGQEVIARQITYDKVTQRLAGIKLDFPAQAGAPIWAEGKRAGTLTSSVLSPRFGPVGLGVIRRPYHSPGTSVRVGEKETAGPGTIVQLPLE
jgi:folate-binding protein YgfZ